MGSCVAMRRRRAFYRPPAPRDKRVDEVPASLLTHRAPASLILCDSSVDTPLLVRSRQRGGDMSLRVPLGALRRVSASVVERNTSFLPSARRALAAPPPVGVARARSMSAASGAPREPLRFKVWSDIFGLVRRSLMIKAGIGAVGVAGTAYAV